jgi:hypothetical protein
MVVVVDVVDWPCLNYYVVSAMIVYVGREIGKSLKEMKESAFK